MPSPLTEALIEQLVRVGILEADDIDDMARRLDSGGHTTDATICRAAFVSALAASQSEWTAEQRRGQIRVVTDGGNPTEQAP